MKILLMIFYVYISLLNHCRVLINPLPPFHIVILQTDRKILKFIKHSNLLILLDLKELN